MKKYAHILFGLLSSLIVIILTTVLVAITDEYFFIFNIFFFVPIGTILLGVVANIGVKKGMIYGNIPYSKSKRLLIVILSIFCFIGIYFSIYKITYISPNMEINYKFHGEHISNYHLQDTLEPVTFAKFLSFEIINRNYNFYFTFGDSGATVPLNVFENAASDSANWMWFVFEGLGFIAGGLYTLEMFKDEKYCNTCNRYFRTRKLFLMDMQDFEQRLIEFNDCIQEGENLKKFIDSLNQLSIIKRKSHVIATVIICPKCYEGKLYIHYRRRTGLGFENIPSKMKKYELEPSVISVALNGLKSFV